MPKPYILVVDDEPAIRTLIAEILADEGYEVSLADNGTSARNAMRTRRPDLVLLDIWMPDIDGISLLKEWGDDERLPCPVIMISGHGTVETAVEATRHGAYDFIEKPLSMAKLLVTVERALQSARLTRENIELHRQTPELSEPVGRSRVIQRLREQVRRIAEHDTWVLMTGEPGTGKEAFARFLHRCSGRREGPFVDVGAGAIAGEQAATELFGSEEAGAIHYGRLEQANGGTLFLDEVADMAAETQARLFSALDSGTFTRVGGSEPVQVNVRIVAASNRNLELQVEEGRFREDLFYHLNVVPLVFPPLREHREDIPELLNFYVDWFTRTEGLAYRHFSVAAQNRLLHYDWPGNVRELKNLVQRLMILGSGDEISLDEVEATLATPPDGSGAATFNVATALDQPLREAREQFERAYLEYHLRACDGNVSRVAALAGIERTHLYRKLRALGITTKRTAK